jgi:hypothetical protein
MIADLSRAFSLIRQLQGAMSGKSLVGPYAVASGNLAPGAYSSAIAPTDPGVGGSTLPAFSALPLFVCAVDKVDVSWGLEVQWQRNTAGTFTFWNAGAHNPAACVLYVTAILL